jgi:hypothetical protein
MSQRKSVTVKAAWIGGSCALAAAIIVPVLTTMLQSSGTTVLQFTPGASPVSPVPSVSSTVPDGPQIAVRREAGFSTGCGSWIVTKPPQEVSPVPPNDAGWEQWIATNNAIDASGYDGTASSNLDVTIQGRSSAQIILTGMQFVVVRRQSAIIQGGSVTNQCGGPMEARYITVNLDSKPPRIVGSFPNRFPTQGEPWQATPIKFPYYVTDTSSEFFKIIASTRGDVTWYAILFWSVDGKNGESIISNGTKPFETAVVNRAAAVYGWNGHDWYVCPKGDTSKCALSM